MSSARNHWMERLPCHPLHMSMISLLPVTVALENEGKLRRPWPRCGAPSFVWCCHRSHSVERHKVGMGKCFARDGKCTDEVQREAAASLDMHHTGSCCRYVSWG